MRITKAETMVVEIPFHLRGSGVGIMPTTWKSLEFTLVRLEDERGNVGWGEGFGYFTVDATKAIIDRLILPTLIGAEIDDTDIAGWNRRVQRAIHMFGRYGITIFAISGVDIALWDLASKRADVPLCELLRRDTVRDSIPIYASLLRYGEPEIASQICHEALAEGFSALKLHEIELDTIEACRTAVGPNIGISVDVNCNWSIDFVRQNGARLEALNLDWLEEPIFPPEDFYALARLRSQWLRIAAGENWCTSVQFAAAIASNAVDIVQPSITKIGGVSEYLAVIDALEASGLTILPHSPYFGPGFFASLHVAAARRSVQALEYNFVRPDAWLADVETLRRGDMIDVPNRPGTGFEPSAEVLVRYRRA